MMFGYAGMYFDDRLIGWALRPLLALKAPIQKGSFRILWYVFYSFSLCRAQTLTTFAIANSSRGISISGAAKPSVYLLLQVRAPHRCLALTITQLCDPKSKRSTTASILMQHINIDHTCIHVSVVFPPSIPNVSE